MTWWNRLFDRKRMEEQLDKELRFHLDEQTADLITRGHTPDEARRLARLGLGGPEQVKEECRDARGTRWLEELWQDLRYALRTLRKKPGFTIAALLTLAFGAAAISTVVTLANTLFFRDLPAERPDRVVVVQVTRHHGRQKGWVSYPEYAHFRDKTETLQGLAAHCSTAPFSVTVNNQSKELTGAVVSANLFPLLGVRPALGRFFRPDEDSVPDRDRVAVIGSELWRNWFGSSPDVLGAALKINGVMFTVIGVVPPTFRGVTVQPDDVYIPLMMARAGYRWCADSLARDCTSLDMLGRLGEGRNVEQSRAEMAALAPSWWASAKEGENSGVTVFRARGALHPDISRSEQIRFIEILSGVAGILLLVCCANLAGLLTARNSARTRELAIRASLGAGGMRLARQLIAEPLLLALGGGVLGMLFSLGLTSALNAMFYSVNVAGHPLYYNFAPEPRVMLAVVAISIAAGLLAGAIPLLKSLRTDAAESLKRESGAVSARPRLGRWLAGTQAGVALALAAVAGILTASAHMLVAGANYEASHIALMRLRLRLVQYPPEKAQRFLRTVMQRLATVPGVDSASMVGNGAVLVGREAQVSLPAWPETQSLASRYFEIAPRYFETLRTPLLRGREFDAHDTLESPAVAIVSDTLAGRLWPAGTAVGASVMVNHRPYRVVGLVADIPLQSRGEPLIPSIYVPFWQNPIQLDARLCMRVKGDPAAMLTPLVRAVNAVDPNVPVAETITLPQEMAGSIHTERVTGVFVSYAAALAVLLSGIGLYGTMAFSVARRTREIGIRLAVGARPAAVLALVIREGMTVISMGVALGVVLAIAGARLVRHLLYGPGGADLGIYAAAILVVACAGLLACWIPARRASRVDPVSALRQE
jgi:macrolide transport system ATP-binding/permease protein